MYFWVSVREPTGSSAALNDQPCPATKLVITPSAPIPAGTTYKVTVNYTGRPGVHVDGDGSTEGFFRNTTPAGDQMRKTVFTKS